MPNLLIMRSQWDWSALYENGHLDLIGDHSVVDEIAMEKAGIEVETSDDFLLGQKERSGAAQTLEEIKVYRANKEERLRKASYLRIQAKNFLRHAEELEQT